LVTAALALPVVFGRKGLVMRFREGSFLALLIVLAVALANCAQETYPPALLDSLASGAAAHANGVAPLGASVCWQTRAQSLPARLVAMSASSGASAETVSVNDLFNGFSTSCGNCHGIGVAPPGQGGLQVLAVDDFPKKIDAAALAHVQSDLVKPDPGEPDDPMPPPGWPTAGPFDARPSTDPIKIWADLVQAWIIAGRPADFVPPQANSGPVAQSVGASPFVLDSNVGNTMTNIGNCTPGPGLVGVEETRSAALDAMFAASMASLEHLGLPADLSDTDLVSFDSQTLAQYGVIAYAPGYPLWSDNAGKLRYVRVPRGTSIHFNKQTQQFDIPPNTRFYKTFLKKVIDTDGSIRWRKIETRLIVSRPDLIDANGHHIQTALFGTYQWNDNESDATLIETARRDGTPFPDTILQYDTDEPLAANIRAGADPANADPEKVNQAVLTAGAARSYAIPGSERCQECHMGSPSAAFVLGFTPLQIARRPLGDGGTIEPAGLDELTQLQRFIDDGLITGIDTLSDVLPLEASQGNRTPRNEQELTAQGYLLGNCAHCHNPIGFPTVQNPVLKDVLNFLPSDSGGIFQFPLERYSPRIFRGVTATVMPYITPSLMDFPESPVAVDPGLGRPFVPFANGSGVQIGDLNPPSVATGTTVIYAPWRSLIYRNVESAFTYADDSTIFPHMPFNTPGYDARLKQIVSDWMVSIPAVRKRPDIFEYSFYTDVNNTILGGPVDSNPQPYVEVLPGEEGYGAAAVAAQGRLAILHTGLNPALPQPALVYSRYADPDDTTDILDPEVTESPVCHPVPTHETLRQPSDVYPLTRHPSWVKTDLTEPATYAPRRPDWAQILVDGILPPAPLTCPNTGGGDQANADQLAAIGLLQTVDLDAIRTFATTPVPFGLWKANPACNFAGANQDPSAPSWWLSAPPVSAYAVPEAAGGNRPAWMDVVNPAADARVFQERPGQAVFKMICINCHGPLADSSGRFADNLANITGGNAHVADFRDGLFGPLAAPETNIDNQFGSVTVPAAGPPAAGLADGGAPDASPLPGGPAQWTGISADSVAARYMAWMALGGTSVTIPLEILELVATTPVLGQSRTLPPAVTSANMLSTAKTLCAGFLGVDAEGAHGGISNAAFGGVFLAPEADNPVHLPFNLQLITTNYDAELWLKLCAQNNPPPVHILQFGISKAAGGVPTGPFIRQFPDTGSEYGHAGASAQGYPPNTPIGNDRGTPETTAASACGPGTSVSCVDPANLWPWCVDVSDGSAAAVLSTPEVLRTVAQSEGVDVFCPDGFVQGKTLDAEGGNAWAVRGAINAGLSVFLYLQWLEAQPAAPPDYNQCELLSQP
jgi:hypothetical protein